ncbi:hypothetical protein NMY22_g17252 [Coprinellus aureogranulatus]|nr:hypothetical protein NMY22_g17252 [Coprinellus aureogranulatus]
MHIISSISIVLLALSRTVSAQSEPTGNLTASLTTYSTSQCCGGSITYNHVADGACVPSAGHPSVYGASITIRGFWGSDFPGGNDHIAYGYLTGFSDSRCQNRIYDIRWNGCTSVDAGYRAASWMWTRETYVPPLRIGINSTSDSSSSKRTQSLDPTASSPSVVTWLSYFDAQWGRERRVSLNKDASEVAAILKLYEQKNYAALNELE